VGEPRPARGRGPLALGAGALALVAIAAVVAVASGGGSDPNPAGGGSPEATAATKAKSKGSTTPETLSRSALIAKADAICEQSQSRYLEIRDLESERSADVPYAEALARFAASRVRQLRALTPPEPLADVYARYVEAQERVYATDRQALAATREEDVAGVEAARDQRDAERGERYDLARALGFQQCSASR